MTPAAIVALCALLFTVSSFWWIQARQGKLKSYEPHSFASGAGAKDLLLRFPIVIYNTGAKPIIVQNFRLVFDESTSISPMPWRTTRSRLMPSRDDGHELPAVFAVDGRKAGQFFLEFGGEVPGFSLEPRAYTVTIEVKVGHKKNWQSMISFPIQGGHIIAPKQYITYSNSLHDLTPETVASAEAALKDLRQSRANTLN